MRFQIIFTNIHQNFMIPNSPEKFLIILSFDDVIWNNLIIIWKKDILKMKCIFCLSTLRNLYFSPHIFGQTCCSTPEKKIPLIAYLSQLLCDKEKFLLQMCLSRSLQRHSYSGNSINLVMTFDTNNPIEIHQKILVKAFYGSLLLLN